MPEETPIQQVRAHWHALIGGLAGRSDARPCPLRAAFVDSRGLHAADFRLATRAWFVGAGVWVRSTEISGPGGTWIVNLGVFSPSHRWAALQFELVIIRDRLMVLICDAIDPNGEFVGPNFSPDAQLSPRTSERPGWCDRLISAGALWSTPASEPAVATVLPVIAVCTRFLHAQLDLEPPAWTEEQRQTRTRFFSRMCDGFREHNPSRRFLRSVFGEELTEQYIDDLLFPDSLARGEVPSPLTFPPEIAAAKRQLRT